MSLDYKKDNIVLAKNLRKNATKQENHLWYDFLSKYPVRFQRQKAIDSFIADFYCHKARLVVEIDGSQHYEMNGIESDKKRSQIFSEYGITVLRFTNIDVEKNFEGVCAEINRKVNELLK